MTCTSPDQAFAQYVIDDTSKQPGVLPAIANALRRLGRAIFDSRQRQVDRDIARILEQSGWRLTDSVEREMMQCLSNSNLSPRR